MPKAIKISSSQREVAHRRELFIAAYAQTGNATAAAIAAGFTEKNAGVQGDKLLRLPHAQRTANRTARITWARWRVCKPPSRSPTARATSPWSVSNSRLHGQT